MEPILCTFVAHQPFQSRTGAFGRPHVRSWLCPSRAREINVFDNKFSDTPEVVKATAMAAVINGT